MYVDTRYPVKFQVTISKDSRVSIGSLLIRYILMPVNTQILCRKQGREVLTTGVHYSTKMEV